MELAVIKKQSGSKIDEAVGLLSLTDEHFLTRKEAAEYLRTRYGAPCAVTATTLAKLAVVGGSPTMHRFGRRVGYLRRDLDKWALSRCSGPVRSTSEKVSGKAIL